MKSEVKEELFEKMLLLEKLAAGDVYGKKTRDTYFHEANGAFKMLDILGLSHEYFEWAFNK